MDLLVKAKNINVEYDGKDLLDIDELEIYDYDRIGIVGRNGVGKSTLLNILSKKVKVTGCKIENFAAFSYIEQLAEPLNEEIENKVIMGKLNINNLNNSNNNLSGGEKTKIKIAEALAKNVDLIYADEPTCNLDSKSIEYITNVLNCFKGAIVVISHNRQFLDNIVNKIWEIENGKINEYWGNYTDYLNQKNMERETQNKNYEKYINEKKMLLKSLDNKIKQAQSIKQVKNNTQWGGILSHQKSSGSKEKALYKSAKAIENRINDLDVVEAPKQEGKIKFRINQSLELHNKVPIMGENLNKEFDGNIIFKNANFKIPLGSKVVITGDNGAGKTTLLKMILYNEKGIYISQKAKIGYFEQDGYKYQKNIRVIDLLSKESDYNISEIISTVCSMGISKNALSRKMESLSGGEIIKILLCKVLLGKYNILIMDEPSNFLDIVSIEALEKLMKSYVGTILFVSHDNKLIENVANIVYKIQNHELVVIKDTFIY